MVPKTIVEIVSQYQDVISVKEILALFDVLKSSYYRWKRCPYPAKYELTKTEIQVIEICKKHHYRYGYRKITALLRRDFLINKNTVQRIMQKHQCQCHVKPKKYAKYEHQPIVMDNVLNRNFKAHRPLEKLVTDITYIPYGSKILYLSTIMDLYNGEIIASTLRDRQDLACVTDTLNQLPPTDRPCILHSDQGSVYISKEYQGRVKKASP